jgi:hypothetical protein
MIRTFRLYDGGTVVEVRLIVIRGGAIVLGEQPSEIYLSLGRAAGGTVRADCRVHGLSYPPGTRRKEIPISSTPLLSEMAMGCPC